jgi:iron(III) transport system ATP-binding protein
MIEVTGLNKTFRATGKSAAETVAVDDMTFSVERGEMVALVGPSGSGKSTLLRCLAGLEPPDSGEISIGSQVVYSSDRRIDVPTNKRNVGVVFQSYALWPHLTVEENVVYPLRRRGVREKQRTALAERYLELVSCGAVAKRYPHQLSGGQQQRVALARALIYEPPVVLFDEPLSNLDATLREQLRYELRRIQKELKFTGVYVTHDQQEAFTVSDRTALLSHGDLLQYGTAAQLYDSPGSAAVASFLGATNSLRGTAAQAGARWTFASEAGELDVTGAVHGSLTAGGDAVLLARADEVSVRPGSGAGLAGRVLDVLALGNRREYVVVLQGGTRWRVRMAPPFPEVDRDTTVEVVTGRSYVYPAGDSAGSDA